MTSKHDSKSALEQSLKDCGVVRGFQHLAGGGVPSTTTNSCSQSLMVSCNRNIGGNIIKVESNNKKQEEEVF